MDRFNFPPYSNYRGKVAKTRLSFHDRGKKGGKKRRGDLSAPLWEPTVDKKDKKKKTGITWLTVVQLARELSIIP